MRFVLRTIVVVVIALFVIGLFVQNAQAPTHPGVDCPNGPTLSC